MGEIIISVPKKKHKVQIIKSEEVLNDFLDKQTLEIQKKFGVFDFDLSTNDGLEDLKPEETLSDDKEIIFETDLTGAQHKIANNITKNILNENIINLNDDIEITENPIDTLNKTIFTEIYTISDDNEPIKITTDFETKNMVDAKYLEEHIQIAYEKGYSDAKEVALLNAKEKISDAHSYIRRIDNFMLELRQHYINQLNTAREKIVEIGTTVAEIIVDTEIDKDSNFIIKQINKILDEINNEKVFSIRINPGDYNILLSAKSQLLNEHKSPITFIPDNTIKTGSLVLSTSIGTIDATITTQLNKLKTEIIDIEREKIPTINEIVTNPIPDITPISEDILMK